MRKITKLVLTLAILFGVVGGVNSVKAAKTYWSPSSPWKGFANCYWDEGTNTFYWNGTNNTVRAIQTGFSGDLSSYTKFHATVTDLTGDGVSKLQLKVNCTGGLEKLIDLASGENLIDMTDWFADPSAVTTFELWGPKSSDASCSAVVTDVYLYKPATLDFNSFGKAVTDKDELVATGGLKYNSSTGALSTDGTAGTLELIFGTPIDLRNLFHFNVLHSGDDNIVDRLEFYDNDGIKINTWQSIKWSNTWNASGLDDNATNAFINHNPVKKLVWVSDVGKSTTLALTISSIEWKLKTLNALKGVDITTLPFKRWSDDGDNDATVEGDVNSWECAKKFNELTGDVIYGGDGIGGSKRYVDLTNYKKLVIRGYGTIRLFYNWHQKVGEEAEAKPMEYIAIAGSEVKTYELDIDEFKTTKGITHFRLVGVKGSGSCFVESISVLDGTEKVDYFMTGSGIKLPSAIAALNDEEATSIDATGVTGITTTTSTLLESVNPNCLFIANSGKLSNTKNVIVSGTCDNLELVDGKPFKAPADFKANSASYTTTINTTAKAGTLCLPFDATIPGEVTAWTLNYTAGKEAVKATEVTTTIPANTPVLLNGNGSADFTGSSVDIDADATNVSGALTGVFNATTVPENSYVLQNGTKGIGFYKVTSDNIVANPFRAYLTADGLGAPSLHIIFPENGDVTGIESVKATEAKGEFFNLAGQRVAQPAKGLYIVNGKKVIFK